MVYIGFAALALILAYNLPPKLEIYDVERIFTQILVMT